jgi:hypothetical protein
MSEYGQQPPYGDVPPEQPGYPGGPQQQPGYPGGYQQPGYPPPGYPQQGYPGYPPPGYPGAYPGYGAPYGMPMGPPPPNHLARAIVAIFFFWPLAIAAIVKATQVESLWARGDFHGAQAASDSARKYANICFIISVVWVAFVLIMFFVVFAAVSHNVPSDPVYGGFAQVRGLLGV